ncbi:hypothetical protein NDU88_004535 [Pleurodeles waltl]|uniref:Uncharacterized protein n=1 Tax=Pleurodeles waltl TaxID=8319 RepID=A0AAV7NMY5_PLEWA|nr:hypothetical protein NDU88_004535 [Pleurodeles waltl]
MAAPSGASIFLNIGEGRQHVCGGEDRAPLLANDTVVVIDSDEDLEIGLDIEEEPLDYEEEDPVHGVQSVAVEKSKTSRQAVQRNRLSCRPQDLAGNLLRVGGIALEAVGVFTTGALGEHTPAERQASCSLFMVVEVLCFFFFLEYLLEA